MPAKDPAPEPSREIQNSIGEIILCSTNDGKTRVECRFEDETIWLSQALVAERLDTSPQNITLHLKALYVEGEIQETATCKDC
jgi:hypothetical protein